MENVVTKGAKSADPMPKLSLSTPGQGTVEDLGGPTPENSKPDDDSNKLKTPGTTLKQVKDIVTKGAKPADPMPAGMKEEEEVEGDVVAEDEKHRSEQHLFHAVVRERGEKPRVRPGGLRGLRRKCRDVKFKSPRRIRRRLNNSLGSRGIRRLFRRPERHRRHPSSVSSRMRWIK